MSINLLPAEILGEVLLFANNNPAGGPYLIFRRSGVPIPLILSSVCRVWRDISLNLPALWSSFGVNPWCASYTDYKSYYERLQQALRMFLGRSKNHLLDLEMDMDSWCHIPHEYDQDFDDTMRLLSDHAHRWGTLILRGHYSFPDVWLSTLTNKLLALHTLLIHEILFPWSQNEQSEEYLKYLGILPALRHLRLGVGVPLTPHYDSFAKLETVHIAALSDGCGSEIRNVINNCTRLRTLTFSSPDDTVHVHTPAGDIPFISRDIEDLNLTRTSLDILTNLGFIFPRLSSITFGAVYHPWDVHGFIKLLQRSSCTITSLAIDGPTRASDDEVITLLTHMPSLTSLSIRDHVVYPSSDTLTLRFFEAFGGVVPLLQRFDLHAHSRAIARSARALAEMIRSRCADKCLRTVLIRLQGPIPEEINSLESISTAGLRIDISMVSWDP